MAQSQSDGIIASGALTNVVISGGSVVSGDGVADGIAIRALSAAGLEIKNGAVVTLESSFMANHDSNEEWKSQQ